MSKLIAFDVDGTFLDSFGFFGRVIERYSLENGLPFPCLDTIQRGYGDPHNHDFKWGVDRDTQFRHLVGAWQLCDRMSIEGEAPGLFDRAKDTLTLLKNQGHTLAIVTSKPEKPLHHALEAHGITGLFSGVRSRCHALRDGKKEKPAPDMLQCVMRELDFAPENTVMVGDTSMDIMMGLASGTHTIGVTWGAHPRETLAGCGAHHIVDTHFGDITATVRKIFS